MREGSDIELTVQLIRGTSDEHLWAEMYDRELTTTPTGSELTSAAANWTSTPRRNAGPCTGPANGSRCG